MDNKKNGIPKLRFPGFTGAWEQRKLGEGTLKIGDGLHGTPKYSTSGNVLFINGNNLINGKVVITSETKRVTSNEQSKDDKELNQNTILMSINGTIGSLAWYRNENLMLGKSVAYIEVSEFDKKFVYAYLQTTKVKFYFISSLTGTTIKNLGLKAIRETPLLIPNIEEQEKIGEFFQQLDSLIALHQRKLEHLQEQKKGLLQKMFPKNGETVPEVRFPGFTDAWEQRKLGEVATFINGRAYKQNELLDSGKYKVLRVGNFYTNDSWYYSNLELADKYYIDEGDLVYTWSATFGPHIWNGEKVIYHYHIWKIELSKFLDRDFTLQILEADKAKLLANTNGSTMIHVTKKDMESKVISLPNIEEQKKIGSYLMKFDSLITLHQRKLDKLKRVKSAYLTEMFSAEGEHKPKRRFAGFTDDWEQRKLGDVVERFDNLRIPVTSSKRKRGITPYYGANGIQDYVQGYTHDGEFVLVAEDGANDLQNYPIHYVNGKVWVNNHAHVLQGKKDIADNLFLVNAIKRIKFETYLVGGSRAKLNADVMMKLPIKMPKLNEQQKLGKYFSRIDTLIALHQRKIDKLQKLKNAYLNEMFV